MWSAMETMDLPENSTRLAVRGEEIAGTEFRRADKKGVSYRDER